MPGTKVKSKKNLTSEVQTKMFKVGNYSNHLSFIGRKWNFYLEKYSAKKTNNSPSTNSHYSSLKVKIIRNLDKICLDPLGNFANSSAVEKYWTWGEYYDTGEAKKHGQYKITDQNGEEINLVEFWSFEKEDVYKFEKEIRTAIINNIKQNSQDWEIYSDGSDSQRENFIKNKKTGVKHYKQGFTIFIEKKNGEWDEQVGVKEWNEIEELLKK